MPIRLTPIVKWLLILNFVFYILQHAIEKFAGISVSAIFGLVPSRVVLDGWLWQILTYSFFHGPPLHLFFNLLMLAFVGPDLEAMWGVRRFIKFYLTCVAAGGLFYLVLQIFFTGGLNVPMIGASGAIFGLLVGYGILFSERTMLFMMLLPMKAKHFVWILGTVELVTLVFSPEAGLSSVAHLGGMAGGVAYLWGAAFWARRKKAKLASPAKPRSFFAFRKARGNLKLVVNNQEPKQFESDADNDPKTWH